MNDEFDFSKVAVEFVQQNIENLLKTGKGVLKGAKDKAKLHLKKTYEEYLKHVGEKYSKSKSFFIRDQPTSIYSFYIPLGLSGRKISIDSASYNNITQINNFCIITGLAGCGKSLMLRHLFLDAIISKGKIPVLE